jgi:hypothetical protein
MITTKVYTKEYDTIPSGTEFYELDEIVCDEKIGDRLSKICPDFAEGENDINGREFIYSKGVIVKITLDAKRDFQKDKLKKRITLKLQEGKKVPKELTDLLEKEGFK